MSEVIRALVCENFSDELTAACEGNTALRFSAYPARCDGQGLTWDTLQEHGGDARALWIVGGPCLARLGPMPESMRGRCAAFDSSCLGILTGSWPMREHERRRHLVVSSGWLRQWRHYVERGMLCQNPSAVPHERVVLLDSGVEPDTANDLEAFAAHHDLPYETQPVGIVHVERQLQLLLKDQVSKERLALSAEYAMALQVVDELIGIHSETEAVHRIFALFDSLMAPKFQRWISIDQRRVSLVTSTAEVETVSPEEIKRLISDSEGVRDDGFVLSVGPPDERLGILEVRDVEHPEKLSQYWQTARSLSRVVALAVSHSRGYEILTRVSAGHQERLSLILSSIGEGVIACAASGEIIFLNEVAARLTGWSASGAVSRALHEVFHTLDEESREPQPVNYLIMNQALESGSTARSRAVLVAADGTERLVAWSSSPIVQGHEASGGAVLVFGDVTDLVRAERDRDRASRAASLGLLAGGIAHDFNNLFGAILGNISLAKNLNLPPHDVNELLSEAETAIRDGAQLTRQLLTFTKSGKPVRSSESISGLLRECCRFTFRSLGSECRLKIPDDLWRAEVDRAQVVQLLGNLLVNASQSMRDAGVVEVLAANKMVEHGEVGAVEAGPYVSISVRDLGGGISPQNVARIFDPFFTTKPQGSGLGLATAFSIVQQHAGHITVESQPGEGSTFRFLLPAEPAGRAQEVQVLASPDLTADQIHVLLVHPAPAMRRMLTRMVEHLGHTAVCVSGRNAAVEEMQRAESESRHFDLALYSIEHDDEAAAAADMSKRLRAGGTFVPSIAASGNPQRLADALDSGAQATLSMPCSLGDLRRALHDACAP